MEWFDGQQHVYTAEVPRSVYPKQVASLNASLEYRSKARCPLEIEKEGIRLGSRVREEWEFEVKRTSSESTIGRCQ